MQGVVNRYKVLSLIVLSVWLGGGVSGQSVHIQSERDMLYYVQHGGAIYNSSETGYLLMPSLAAGIYTLVMGFPGTARPEYAFQCTITDKPVSFFLKLGMDNSWSLFDMVDFTVTYGAPATKTQLEMALAKPGQPKATGPGQPPTPAKANIQRIRKIFDKATPGGVDQVYIVTNGGKADTVALFIPALEQVKPKETGSLYRTSLPESPILHKTLHPDAALLPRTGL